MNIHILRDANELGQAAAQLAAALLNEAIRQKGSARLVLSTGQSQFETLEALVRQPVHWGAVELFHLDEYIGLLETHPASFRKYLKERFISHINLKSVCLVNGEGNIAAHINELNTAIARSPIDLGLIGIGENAHIAFNDPPADFSTSTPYIVVNLNQDCKRQQVREGWFPDLASVPDRAISMSVRQILTCGHIISCVPHQAKAHAIRLTMDSPVDRSVPASILKTHPAWDLFLDTDSASELPASVLPDASAALA
jgi:glucosamine-6-phosphate deaminase